LSRPKILFLLQSLFFFEAGCCRSLRDRFSGPRVVRLDPATAAILFFPMVVLFSLFGQLLISVFPFSSPEGSAFPSLRRSRSRMDFFRPPPDERQDEWDQTVLSPRAPVRSPSLGCWGGLPVVLISPTGISFAERTLFLAPPDGKTPPSGLKARLPIKGRSF